MSSFKEAVEEWNRRHQDGWRSSYHPTLECRQCAAKGLMLTTIYGHTKATCTACEASYEL